MNILHKPQPVRPAAGPAVRAAWRLSGTSTARSWRRSARTMSASPMTEGASNLCRRCRSMKCTRHCSVAFSTHSWHGTGHSHEGPRVDDLSASRGGGGSGTGPVLLLRQRRPSPQTGGLWTSPSIRRRTCHRDRRSPAASWIGCTSTPACGFPRCGGSTARRLIVHRLRRDGAYRAAPRSVELPFLPLDETPDLFQQSMAVQEDRAIACAASANGCATRSRPAPAGVGRQARRRRRSDG